MSEASVSGGELGPGEPPEARPRGHRRGRRGRRRGALGLLRDLRRLRPRLRFWLLPDWKNGLEQRVGVSGVPPLVLDGLRGVLSLLRDPPEAVIFVVEF